MVVDEKNRTFVEQFIEPDVKHPIALAVPDGKETRGSSS